MIKRHHALLGSMMMFAACSGDCSCDGFEERPFPPQKYSQMIPNSGVVRVTPTGFDFVEDNLPAILDNVVPGGLDFCVPATSGTPAICNQSSDVCTNGDAGCQLNITIDDALITPMPTDTLEVDVTLGGLDETLSAEVVGIDCLIRFHAQDDSLPAKIGAKVPLTFTVDSQSPTNDVKITAGEVELDLNQFDFTISGVSFLDDLACRAANIGFVQDLLVDQIVDQFQPIIDEIFTDTLCTSCADAPCQTGTCNADQICESPNGECVPILLGVEGGLQLGAVIGDFSETPEAEVDVSLRVADTAQVDTGLTLGLRSAYEPTAFSNCIPVDPTNRDYSATPLSPVVTGNNKPNGDTFMFGVGYHKRALEQMLWSVWGSGATCFRIGSAQVDLLTTGLLGGILPSLRTLSLNKSSEVYIKIVPQTEPLVQLGANTVDANGEIVDPLMSIDWKDFDLHIYGYFQSQFTRVATIRMDLLIPIGMSAESGEITILIGDLADGIKNARVVQSEMIAEDPQRLLDLIPTLISMALPSLTESLADPIELPEFFGFRLDIGPGDITSVDNNTYLAIFGNLALAPASPVRIAHDTKILSHRVSYNGTLPSGLVKPVVELEVATTSQLSSLLASEPAEILFSYRVDNGLWSSPQPGPKLRVEDPILVIPGNHKIEVRSMQKGARSLEIEPEVMRVRVDYTAPELVIDRRQSSVDLIVSDDLSDSNRIETRYKLGDSSWSPWQLRQTIDTNVSSPTQLFVEARDENGNVTQKSVEVVTVKQGLQSAGPTKRDPPASEPKAGCSVASQSGSWVALLFALFLFGRRRKRLSRQSLLLATFGVALTLSSCDCGEDPVANCQCEGSQVCVDNQCVDQTCTDDDDCGDQVCVNSVCVDKTACENNCNCPDGEFGTCNDADECVCEPYCESGCGDSQFCCFQNNACQAIPDPCADTVCDAGLMPEVSGTPMGDSETCEQTGAKCECVPIPPLDIGIHGQFPSFDQFGTTTVISTYNSTYEDLMVGIVSEQGETTWYWVDGVPADGLVIGAEDGPRNGISTRGEDVGTHTAVVVDDSQTIHVVYRDEDRDMMKYARGTLDGEVYSFETTDFVDEPGNGYWPNMIRTGNQVDLVYSARVVESAPDTFETRLLHVTFDVTAPADNLAPVIATIDSAPAANPCGFGCAAGMTCFETAGVCGTATADCATDCGDELCYQGVCQPAYSEGPQGYDLVVGGYTELSRTTDGFLLVYFDRFADSIKWTRFDGTEWTTPTLVGATSGPFGSGVVDNNGDVALAYQDRSQNRIVFELNDVVEEIRNGVRDTSTWWLVNEIGENVQLRQNESGEFIVVYQDATEHILYRGVRPAANSWTITELAAPGTPYAGANGFYISLLKSGTNDTFIQTRVNSQTLPPSAGPTIFQ